MDIVCPLCCLVVVVLLMHLDVGPNRFNNTSTPYMKRFVLDIFGLQLSIIKLFRLLEDEIRVLGLGSSQVLITVEDDIVPEGLEGEAVLARADGADIRNKTEDLREDVENRKSNCACEEEISLRAMFVAFVPVTTSRR